MAYALSMGKTQLNLSQVFLLKPWFHRTNFAGMFQSGEKIHHRSLLFNRP